jgi:hypothetical protein
MTASVSPILAAWSSFYAMTGSSAAALIGLMFVVITLVTGTERRGRNPDGIKTFSTPTVMHFGAALFVSAVLNAPWGSLVYAAVSVGLAGIYGVALAVRVMRRTKRLTEYTPDLEDWVWYTILPFVAYGAICAGAIGLAVAPRQALFALAGAVLLLIFIGIRNAWDVVTFLAIGPGSTPEP